MDYVSKVKLIWENVGSHSDKLLESCNLLIPKVMYIPYHQLDDIEATLQSNISLHELSDDCQALLEIILSFFQYKRSNYTVAIQRMVTLYQKRLFLHPNIKASVYVVIATSYRSLGDKEHALQFFQQAIEKFKAIPIHPYLQYFKGISIYHISEMYGELGEYNEMLKKHFGFLDYGHQTQNHDFENRALNGIGRAYQAMGKYDFALDFLKKADLKVRAKGNIPFLARNLHDLGSVYSKMKDYTASLDYYHQALKLRTENKLLNASITTYMAIGKVLIQKGAIQKGIEILHQALDKASEIKVNNKICQIYKILSEAYESLGQLDDALKYFKQFYTLKSELDNVDKTKVENQKIREANSLLKAQKELIATQKHQIEVHLQKVEETTKYLENFAAVAAHDLKAPVRIASSFAKILHRKYKDKFDPKDVEYFRFISDNIGRLGIMIDDLLSLSKLDQDLPPPRLTNINDVLQEVLTRLKARMDDTKAVVQLNSDLPYVEAHNSLIVQLFQNIIENAMKHRVAARDPKIIIHSRPFEANAAYHLFEIRDNGEGIPHRLQPYVFELFNGSNKNDSTGIGLATCKKIVSLYGGKIWVESEPTVGTSIFFTLKAM